ncbi:MAG TPA: tryptophan--tRNA ligase, partial [Acidiphilium sp.]
NDIAQKFNHDYGVDFFPAITPRIIGGTARIMSLRDGAKKMSKSDPSDQSRINLTDDADTIAQKIRRAKTDPEPLPDSAEKLEARPEARNLVGIYAALADVSVADILRDHAGQGFGGFKDRLTELVVAKITPIGTEAKRLAADPGTIEKILQQGAARAAAIADPIASEAERIVGLLPAR